MSLRLQAGQAAPEFSLPTADGGQISLAELRGHKVVVYFYPAAGTPGCTTQACDFRDSLASLSAHGYTVVGISPDPVEKLARFAAKQGLDFALASDAEKTTLRAYGAFGLKKLYGREVEGVIRSTFVIDAEGTIELAQYNVKATGHVARLRKQLQID